MTWEPRLPLVIGSSLIKILAHEADGIVADLHAINHELAGDRHESGGVHGHRAGLVDVPAGVELLGPRLAHVRLRQVPNTDLLRADIAFADGPRQVLARPVRAVLAVELPQMLAERHG
jgi:hypothetical protein